MVLITKDEKEYISKNYPFVHIVRTMRQKSKRHRYYCEEHPQVMRYLDSTRCNMDDRKKGRNGFKKKAR